MNDRERAINPYQPPPTPSGAHEIDFAFAGINLEIDDKTPISFSGAADAGDLKQFLCSNDRLGAFPLIAGILFAALFQLWALIISSAFAMMVAGGVVIALLTIMTSSRWYRASLFRSLHPTWDEFAAGELNPAGLHIKRRTESAFYRWSWFSGVVIADSMVGFVPAEEGEMPIFISSSMLPEAVTFSRLQSFARSAKVVCENEMTDATIGWANQQVMREARRLRSHRSLPADAIVLEGPVTGFDLKSISQQLSPRARPLRAHLIRILLLLAVALCALGFVATLGQIADPMFVLMLLLVIPILAILVVLRTRRRSKLMSSDNLLYHLIAYVSDQGITTDFFVAVTTVPWSNLAVQHVSAERILIRQKSSRKLLIVRHDMFSSEEEWQRFIEMTRIKQPDSSGVT